jgi:hypothetical protein
MPLVFSSTNAKILIDKIWAFEDEKTNGIANTCFV